MKHFTYTIGIAILLLGVTLAAFSQTRTFTYQGKLADAGQPANGTYLFQFKLFDTANSQVGVTLTDVSSTVTDGIFAVQLDFGPTAWTGPDRLLEISVRHTVSEPYVTLNPRQNVTSSPYATRSASAQQADNATTASNSLNLGGIAANQYVQTGDPRLSDARAPTAGSTNYIQNTASFQNSANFNISGNGSAGGTLTGNVVNATTQINLGATRAMTGNFANANMSVGLLSGAATSGTSNSYFGVVAGAANTTGHDNSFFGAGTGNANTTGFENSFFGAASGQSNGVGTDNSFFGFDSGQGNSSGSSNTFSGSKAGLVNSTGSLNSFFGAGAGQANTTAGNGSFFGFNSGFLNTGTNNSFFGSGSGRNNGSGFNNSYFGKDAGFNSGASNRNSFFGYSAGFTNSVGNSNSFFGASAGAATTAGSANSFFGDSSGSSNVDGQNNTFDGFNSGLANTSGLNNTFIGSRAGQSNVTGSDNTMIGTNTALLANNLTNATAIGYRASVAQDNSLVLGSISGVNGGADTKVGIGTTTPSERLTIRTASNAWGWVHTQDDIVFGSYIGGTGAAPYGGWIGTKTNHPLSFFVNSGGAAMTLETSGFLRLNNIDTGGSGPSLCINNSNHISFCSSSLRYKTNVAPFTPGLNMVKRLTPITFDWKDGGGHDLGFGAEEVAKVSDLLVIHNKQGQVEGVKYDRISAVLVNAVKEQQEEIELQSKTIERQQAELDALKTYICTQNPSALICKAAK